MSFALRVTLILILIILCDFYFYKKFVNSFLNVFPRISKKKFKRIFFWSYIYLNLYAIILLIGRIFSIFSRNIFLNQPEGNWFDILILFPFWISVIITGQSVLFFLILDFLKLIIFPFVKSRKEKLQSILYKINFGIIIFFIIYAPANIIYNYLSVEVREIEYAKKDLPKELDNFKITFISDLHADKYTNAWRLENYIEKINATNPDLVLVAGDIISSGTDYIKVGAKYLGKIKTKYGVFSCVGDHDNWAYRPDYLRSRHEVINELKSNDVIMIDNGNKKIKVGESIIGITFITETYSARIGNGELNNLVDQKKNDLNIFLVHQPRENLIELAQLKNYDLFLAGHTHGGQITFLFPFIDLSVSLFETSSVRGDFYFDNMLMIVTRGLGMSIAPLRYNSAPEVVVIKLKRK
ncbi:MAG: metallophosphoesterase [Ignavibacteriaceae bacterium]